RTHTPLSGHRILSPAKRTSEGNRMARGGAFRAFFEVTVRLGSPVDPSGGRSYLPVTCQSRIVQNPRIALEDGGINIIMLRDNKECCGCSVHRRSRFWLGQHPKQNCDYLPFAGRVSPPCRPSKLVSPVV